MDRCTELCTRDITGSCAVCEARAEADRFMWRWFKGGVFIDGARALKRGRGFACLRRYACLIVRQVAPRLAQGETADERRERQEASDMVPGSPFDDLPQILASHQLWRQSKKIQGAKANLSYRRITSLAKTDLGEADLHGANLSGADLRNATLWRANLSQTDLSKADLHGTILRDANLQEANLTNVTGLLTGQLAGTDIANAQLPADLRLFTALDNVKELSDSAQKVFLSMLIGCVYCWLTMAITTDAHLLTNLTSSPLPLVQTAMPIVYFFWVAPLILLCVYGYLHVYLQRLWEGLAQLPAVLPDGRTLNQRASSWLLNGLVSIHLFQLRDKRPSFTHFQAGLSIFLAWGLVPITILLFLVRYLPKHSGAGTVFHLLLLGISLWWGLLMYVYARATLQGRVVRWYKHGIAISVLTISTCIGVSSFFFTALETDCTAIAQDSFAYLRRHLATANLIEATVSTRPPNWTGKKEEEIALVNGARLMGEDLTCASARGAFLVKADLRNTVLRRADLSKANLFGANFLNAELAMVNFQEADLRETIGLTWSQLSHTRNMTLAFYSPVLLTELKLPPDHNEKLKDMHLAEYDLHEANLQGAVLWRANLQRAILQGAILQRANLQGAVLWRANLLGASLEEANLQGANLHGANLQGANLHGANLHGANLHGARFPKAVLLRANLQGANLPGANLRGAFLWQAPLQGANLQGANLRGANLQGAFLQGANLTEAQNLTPDLVQTACGDKNTNLPAYLKDLTLPPCPK